MTEQILVVEDDLAMSSGIRDVLEMNGYRVQLAENGVEGLKVLETFRPDLIISDIMMPEMDGFEFIRAYRKESDKPIILLTAKLEESDKVIGLELGADDYITKPFGMRELVARIHTVLRRAGQIPHPSSRLQIGDIVLDRETHSATVSSRPVHLTPSEFDLLDLLMNTPGRVYTRLDLLEDLQGTSFEGVARTIDVHIRNLRTKIESNPASPRYIETVFGIGYRFKLNN
jgi:DNA-binding response OmpR family regulator